MLAPPTAHAGANEVGTTAASFLLLSGGARDAGLAGAGLGWSEDLGGATLNPAVLGWLERYQLAVGHAPTSDATSREWMAFGGRLGHTGLRLGATGVYHSLGSFDGRDAANNPTGSFSASDLAAAFSLAHVVRDMAAFGLTVKYVREDLGEVAGSGATFDLGGQLRAGPVGVGLALQNLGGSMGYQGSRYPFPTNFGAGVSVALPTTGLRLLADLNVPRGYYNDLRAGVEWDWHHTLALRMGYRHELGGESDDLLNGPAFGLGAGKNGFWLDYAFDPGTATGEHRLSLRFTPGAWIPVAPTLGHAEWKPVEARPTPSVEAPARQPVAAPTVKRPAPARDTQAGAAGAAAKSGAPPEGTPSASAAQKSVVPNEPKAPAPASVIPASGPVAPPASAAPSAPQSAPVAPQSGAVPRVEAPPAPTGTDAPPAPGVQKVPQPSKPAPADSVAGAKPDSSKQAPNVKPAKQAKEKRGKARKGSGLYSEAERAAAERAGLNLPGDKKK
jgi:hypothetical protein